MERVWLPWLGAILVLGLSGCAATPPTQQVAKLLVTTAENDGPGSLRAVVAEAEAGAVVAFDTEGVFAVPRTITLASQIVLDRAVTIEGPDQEALTVSGNHDVRAFRVTGGAAVVIQGLTVANGSAALETVDIGDEPRPARAGGAVLVDAGASLTLRAVAVVDSEAAGIGGGSGFGGGIANLGGTLVVRDASVVAGNLAGDGGGIATIGATASTTVTGDSVVSDNTAEHNGGGVFIWLGSQVVDASVVRGNWAPAGGGMSNQGGTLEVRAGSVVSSNQSVRGAGLYNTGSATVSGSTFGGDEPGDGNVAEGGGGGIHNEITLVVREGSRVVGNVAAGPVTGTDGGGGILNLGQATIEGSGVESNESATRGGGIANHGTLSVLAGSWVQANDTTAGGGGIANESLDPERGHALISASTVSGNTAALGAGVDSRGSGSLTIVDATIRGNVAGQSGGGVYVTSDVTISGSTIGGDAVEDANQADEGGGIHCTCPLLVEAGSRVAGNTATTAGGGLYLVGGAGATPLERTITGSTFEGNDAPLGGGIYFAYQLGSDTGVVTLSVVDGSVLRGNSAEIGGGLYQTQMHGDGGNARTILDAAVVEDNTATEYGGGLANEGGVLTIRNGTVVHGNVAAGNGGGLFDGPNVVPSRETTTVIQNSTFDANAALAGGGIYHRDAELSVSGSVFTSNAADSDGGAVSIEGGEATIVFSAVTIGGDGVGNTAALGGGIYNLSGQVQLVAGTQVTSNVARLLGGGLYNGVGASMALAASVVVTGNEAQGAVPAPGGGIFNAGTLLNDGTVSGNSPDDVAP
jgi:fibronectin-binding autotransporter adhesin